MNFHLVPKTAGNNRNRLYRVTQLIWNRIYDKLIIHLVEILNSQFPNHNVVWLEMKLDFRGCSGLLHKLHHGAAPQKTGVCGVPL
jgi:hypothetical protein